MSDRVEAERRGQLAAELEAPLARTDELELERALLAAIVEQMPAGLAIANASTGRISTANEEARRLLGSIESLDELDARYPDGTPYRREDLPLVRALAGELVVAAQVVVTRPGRGRVVLDVSAAPVRDRAGRVTTAVGIFRDITAEERRERAERDFLTNAAHELQSPLAAITSAVEVLQAGAKDTPNRDLFLDHIDREAQRLGRLTRALLTLSRAQTEVEEPRAELIELRAMLQAIAGRMTPAEGVSILVECDAEVAVLSNRELLEQALSNLVLNSVKYTTEGSIRLCAEAQDGAVEISVEDTGGGIAEEALPRVFERFYRSNSHEGSGLGLAIVQASVEALGGEVGIKSAPGKGTEVRVHLPSGASLVGPER
jgi:PAS domain S-box-containing protein